MGKAARAVFGVFFVGYSGSVSKEDAAGESGFFAGKQGVHMSREPLPYPHDPRRTVFHNFRFIGTKLGERRFSARGGVFLPFGYFDSFAWRKTVYGSVKSHVERSFQPTAPDEPDFRVEPRRTYRRDGS